METELSIIIVCLFGSFATFFSGFGLGTILLPVFSIYFSVELAILATAIVHLANNIFKMTLLSKHLDFSLFKNFGITAFIGAILGACLLKYLGNYGVLYSSPFFDGKSVRFVSFVIGLIMLGFVIFEWKVVSFKGSSSRYFLAIGGFISGFFGGLSGHQGALRSAFLSKVTIDKHVFVATSVAISLLIDISRISIYASASNWKGLDASYLILGALSAFIGSMLGKKYLEKVSYNFIKWIVALFLVAMGGMLLTGWI